MGCEHKQIDSTNCDVVHLRTSTAPCRFSAVGWIGCFFQDTALAGFLMGAAVKCEDVLAIPPLDAGLFQ